MDEARLGQLRDFIVEARKQGESYDVIRQQLLAGGWSDADVNEYLPTAWQQVEAAAAPAVPPAMPPAVMPATPPAAMPATPPAAMPATPPAAMPSEPPAYQPPVVEPITPAAEEKPAAYAPPVAPPVVAPAAYPPPAQPAYGAPVAYGYGADNTSGNPQAPVPPEVEAMGWSWGGFGLNWIWGIGNKTYIALLALIPCVNIFVAIWLGISGHKMAWQNRRFESFEQYRETMKAWNVWGLIIFLVGLAINIISTIISLATQKGS